MPGTWGKLQYPLQTTTPRGSIQEWRRRGGCGQADLIRRRDYISTLRLSHSYISRCCGCAVLHISGPESLRINTYSSAVIAYNYSFAVPTIFVAYLFRNALQAHGSRGSITPLAFAFEAGTLSRVGQTWAARRNWFPN
jgi:hypothetical protein